MAPNDRRRKAQAGTTLVELVVSVAIIGFGLLILVGAFSTALIDVTNQKRITVAQGALEFELQKIQSATYASNPQAYSECFASDGSVSPFCGQNSVVKATATEQSYAPGVQQWTVQITTYPSGKLIGTPVSVYKINR